MQHENETFRAFLRRTDDLAVRLGKKIDDLPDVLGISRASLFGYRAGTRNITGKAWRKLELAERTAGIAPAEPEPAPNRVAEPSAPYSKGAKETKIDRLEKEMRALHEKMDRLLECLEEHKKI